MWVCYVVFMIFLLNYFYVEGWLFIIIKYVKLKIVWFDENLCKFFVGFDSIVEGFFFLVCGSL